MSKSLMMTAVFGLTLALMPGTSAHAGDQQYDMRVDGLTCPFCVATSTKALKKIDGVTEVVIDLEEGLISVCAGPGTDLNEARMEKLFRKKGFTYRSQTVAATCQLSEAAGGEAGESSGDQSGHSSATTYGSHTKYESDTKYESGAAVEDPKKADKTSYK